LVARVHGSPAPVIARLGDVIRLRDDTGRTLLDLADAPRPVADTPAPPRFLPMWDVALLGHDDRTRLLPDAYRKAVISRNGDVLPTFLVDGRVAGLWWVEPVGEGTRIALEPFVPLTKAVRTALDDESERLRAFYEPIEPRLFARYRQSAARHPLPER
jgi:hypothetical protein